MEYSNEFLARVYGAYIHCEVKCKKLSGWKLSQQKTTLDLYFLANYYERIDKLLLTPPSAITDEDAIEVAKILNNRKDDKELLSYLVYQVKLFFRGDQYGWLHFLNAYAARVQEIIQISDYLRSQGYMIPYMGIDLFDAGLAIDKTTLNK